MPTRAVHGRRLSADATTAGRLPPPRRGNPGGIFPARWFLGPSIADLHTFLASSLDLLVLATPLTGNTHHALTAWESEVLAEAGKGRTYICNVGRGAVIRTDDLVEGAGSGADPRRRIGRYRSGNSPRKPPAMEGQRCDYHVARLGRLHGERCETLGLVLVTT